MMSMRQRNDGTFYLTWDRERRFTNNLRGLWVYVGPTNNALTDHCVHVNAQQGLYCLPDDEGNTHCLVLED